MQKRKREPTRKTPPTGRSAARIAAASCALSVGRTIFVWGKHAWERVPTRIRCAAGRGRRQERSEGAGVPKQHLSAGRAAARHRQQPRSTARGAGARQHAHLHHLCRFPAQEVIAAGRASAAHSPHWHCSALARRKTRPGTVVCPSSAHAIGDQAPPKWGATNHR